MFSRLVKAAATSAKGANNKASKVEQMQEKTNGGEAKLMGE